MPTRSQQQMIADGLPAACIIDPAVRAEQWRINPPRPVQFIPVKRDKTLEQLAIEAEFEEQKRTKALNRIAKMKSRQVDRTGQRWNSRKNRWENDVSPRATSGAAKFASIVKVARSDSAVVSINEITPVEAYINWSRVNKGNARQLAELNGVWDDKYIKLTGGLLTMTVTNRLKGLVKKGLEVKWA